MRSGKSTFWLPLTRLGAFFGAVVIAGNVLFHAVRSEAASLPQDPVKGVDTLSRKKKRLERRFFRLLDRFLGAPASAATLSQEKLAAGVLEPIVNKFPAAVERLGALEPEA